MSASSLRNDFRQLGSTGARVSPLCLGTYNFGRTVEEREGAAIIHKYLAEGFGFIDTANVYGGSESEAIVGRAIKHRRHDVFLATKVWGRMGDGPNDQGNSRVHILREVENSLRRLQTDHIDLYWIHRPDPLTPIEETLHALDILVRSGKVRYVGCSTFPAWQIMEALWKSQQHHIIAFAAEQPPYNLFDRSIETEVLPLCRKYGLGVMPWGPLAAGWLSGAYRRDRPFPRNTRITETNEASMHEAYMEERLNVIENLMLVADDIGCTLIELSIAWLLHQEGVTSPIVGPSATAHLDAYFRALEVKLTPDTLSRIDRIVKPGERVGGRNHYD